MIRFPNGGECRLQLLFEFWCPESRFEDATAEVSATEEHISAERYQEKRGRQLRHERVPFGTDDRARRTW